MDFTKKYYKAIDETIYEGTHKSGLKVYVMPKKGFSKSYAIYATNYGSINTSFVVPGQKEITNVPDGVAHFLEHKLFEEPDGKNVFEQFSALGASANAFTSFVMTAYLFSSTNNFYENLEVLLGYTNRPYFTKENVSKEQGIIGQEIKMYQDDAGWRVFFNTLKALYHEHTARIDIAGTVESIAEIDENVLYNCYNTFYHPSNMALFTVGDVDPEKVSSYVEKMIKQDSPLGKIDQVFPVEPPTVNKPYIEQELSVAMPMFNIAYKDIDIAKNGEELIKKDAVASILLDVIAGNSSPLYKRLYEQGLINNSFSASYEGELSFAFSSFSGESSNPEAVLDALQKEIAYILENGIDKEAFERSKRLKYGISLRLLDRMESFANLFVGFALKGGDFLNYSEIINEVTLEELRDMLNKHFKPEMCVMSVVKPEEKK